MNWNDEGFTSLKTKPLAAGFRLKVSRRVTAIALIALLALVGLELYLQSSASSSNLSPWAETTPYPLQSDGTPGVVGQSCVVSNGTVYCIGGQGYLGDPHDNVFSAVLSASGVGEWKNDTNAYPQDVMFQSCVAYSSDVYCIGGVYDTTADDVAYAYYAPLTPSGVGAWKSTTSYPIPVDTESCVASSGYVYCIGGENQTTGTNSTSIPSVSDWYATISPSGIGNWTPTTPYPQGLYIPVCTTLGGYAYCVGDEASSGQAQQAAYYAALSPEGLGAWTATAQYPIDDAGQSCVVSSTDLFCVAGWTGGTGHTSSVYYALLTPGGIGTWQAADDYPVGVLTDCVSSSGYIYCFGGSQGSSGAASNDYYGLLVPSTTTASGTNSST